MKKRRWRNTVATLAVLVPVVAVVVYSSFQVSEFECEVCMTFEGNQSCRRVNAKTELEALRGATDNACALIASGVTQTMRCTHSEPTTAKCKKLSEQ